MSRLRLIIDRFIAPTCMLDVLICAFFMLVQFNSSAVNYSQPGMTPSGFLTCLAFSALVVLSGQVFRSALSLPAATLIHCLLSTLSFLVCFVFLGSYYADRAVTALIMAIVFILFYFVIALPVLLLERKRRAKKNDSQAYTSMLHKSAK